MAGGWWEAAAALWGKGCCSPLSPEMGKPDVGGDVRDGGGPPCRCPIPHISPPTARLLADSPALCD